MFENVLNIQISDEATMVGYTDYIAVVVLGVGSTKMLSSAHAKQPMLLEFD